MRHHRQLLTHKDFYPGRRVYVGALDVFGILTNDCAYVVCEDPMPGYIHQITIGSRLYDDAIGDRDSRNPPSTGT